MADGHIARPGSALDDAAPRTPVSFEDWVTLGTQLVAQGRASDVLRLVELRHGLAGDGLQLFSDCLGAALRDSPDHGPILAIAEATPADNILKFIARYMGALVSAQRGEIERGIAEIVGLARIADILPAQFKDVPAIATIIAEGQMLEGFDAVAALEALDDGELLTRLGGVQQRASFVAAPPQRAERFIFLSSCDERYLDRFGPAVVRALEGTGARTTYHLHIVDPSPMVDAKIGRLQETCSNIALSHSTETYERPEQQGYWRASFYACSRLVRLPEVLARYDCDVFMCDMDTERVRRLDELLTAMEGADIGYFHMANTRLSLVCHLAAVYFSNNPTTRRFADLNRKYILAKLLRTPLWLLDQTSFYCASRYLAATSGLRIADFSRLPGGDFYSHVAVASSSAEKQRLRASAGA